MTGHFTTMCGCEKYESNIPYPPPMHFRLVTKNMITTFSGRASQYGYRVFKLVTVDMKHALAHYEEDAQ